MVMPNEAFDRELREQCEELPAEERRKVLDFARALRARCPRGTRGANLVRFAGAIRPADLAAMAAAIEAGCEQVRGDEW